MAKILKLKISDTARLPLKYSMGTEKQRFELATQLEKRFLKELNSSRFTSKCSIGKFTKTLRKILSPFDIDFIIEKNTNELVMGSMGYLFNYYKKGNTIQADLEGYTLKLPINKTNITDKYTALHEVRHLFDHICNPKLNTLIRRSKYYNDEELDKIILDIKNSIIYKSLDLDDWASFEKEVKTKLSKVSSEDAINVLQIARSHFKTEINAYESLKQYLRENPIKNFSELLSLKSHLKNKGMYVEKLNFVNKLLKDEFKKVRVR